MIAMFEIRQAKKYIYLKSKRHLIQTYNSKGFSWLLHFTIKEIVRFANQLRCQKIKIELIVISTSRY